MKQSIRALLLVLLGAMTSMVLLASGSSPDDRMKTFSVQKGGLLDLNTSVGDIRISPWDKNEVSVKVEGIDEDDLDRLKMEQSGNTIRVSFRPRWGGWEGGVRFFVSVPAEFNLDLETSGGDIVIDRAIKGKIEGSTAGGDIKLANITGDVDMSTSGGDVEVGDVTGSGYLKTAGGDITVGKVGGTLEVRTSGGNIRVDFVSKSLEAKTAGGDIRVGDVGGEADVSTSGGDIHVGKVSGKAKMSTAGGDITLDGASGTVSARTAGGDIKLRGVTGVVEAKTAGGEVEAELNPSGKGSSRLASSGGEVRLYIPEAAKATIEATIRIHGSWGRRSSRYDIRSDFTADVFEKDDDDEEIRGVYKLNGGGERIELETVNADIQIRKGRMN